MRLKHVALYAKGYYEGSGNLMNDLKACLEADGIGFITHIDVCRVIGKSVIPKIHLVHTGNVGDFVFDMLRSIDKSSCRTYIGYDPKEYDIYEACTMYFLSQIRDMTISEIGGLPQPNPSVLPLKKY